MANLRILKSQLPSISSKVYELGHKVPEVSSITDKFQRASVMLEHAIESIESQHKNIELSKQTIVSLRLEILNCVKEIESTQARDEKSKQSYSEIYSEIHELISQLLDQLDNSKTAKDSCEHLDIIAQMTSAASEIEEQSMRLRGNILVMSQSQNTLDSLQRRLGAIGHNMILCKSFERLKEHFKKSEFDIIIYDAEGAEDYGRSVLEFATKQNEKNYTPVIVMGPLKDTLLINQSMEVGADDFLPKPPNPALLKARINSALLQKEASDRRQKRIQELRSNQENLEKSIAELPEGIAIFDRNSKLVMHNNSYIKMYPHLASFIQQGLKGASFAQIAKANIAASIYDNSFENRQNILENLTKYFSMPTANWREELLSGQTYEAVSYRTPDGGIVLTVSDISKNIKDKEKLEFMAFHDSLTGLANRVLFIKRLEKLIKSADKQESMHAVVNIDLDGFKAVNDTYGHGTGDWVLTQVANRLTRLLREQDTVARFGGDEFCILLENMTSKQQIGSIAERIIDTIRQPYKPDNGDMLEIGSSIGIAIFPGDSNSAEGLIIASDKAMYLAKNSGKGTFKFCGNNDT